MRQSLIKFICRRLVAPLLVTNESKESVWREVDDSFVGPVPQDLAKL